jgi:endonuclease/exonuclease/phosphatase family metal-dependent hydrolase
MEVQNAWANHLSGVKDRYPYQKVLADPAYTGVAFLSKIPWESMNVVMLGEVTNPSIDVKIPCLGPLSRKSSRNIRIIGTHPLPPFGNMLTRSRDGQLKTLSERFVAHEPNLLVGDLNISPWSPRFSTILRAGNLIDASLGYGIETTLAPLPTWLGGVKVDHILVDHSIRVLKYQATRSAHSDHKMVSVDFAVEPD